MATRSRRVRLSRLLLALPFLLLVPLSALKWRADHPPVSTMDERLRATLNPASAVLLMGNGNAKTWQKVTGLDATRGINITDRAVLRALMATLRCRERMERPLIRPESDSICLNVTGFDTRTHRTSLESFTYWRDAQGSYITPGLTLAGGEAVMVQSRFVPLFEALINRLAQRAKAKGRHPEVTLQPLSVLAPIPVPPAP